MWIRLVLQYPLRPPNRPYDLPDEAKYKPHNKILEISCEVKKDEEYYGDSAAPHLQQPKQVLQSTRILMKTTYTIGIVQNGQFVWKIFH